MGTAIRLSVLLGLLGLAVVPAQASRVHVFLSGATQGALECEPIVSFPDRKGSVAAISLESHLVVNQKGVTDLRPVRFTKRIDRCTPLITKALHQNEELTALIRFYAPGPDGTVINYFTIKLEAARVVSQDLLSSEELPNSTDVRPQLEHVSVTYKKITWRHELASTEHSIP